MVEKTQKAWRFYRSNLSTIVWDKDGDKKLADFSEGHFTTADIKVAAKLKQLGYPEIPLNATEPPAGIIINQPSTIIDGDVPIMSAAVNPMQMAKRMASITREVGGPPKIKIPSPLVDEKPKSSLKRRKK